MLWLQVCYYADAAQYCTHARFSFKWKQPLRWFLCKVVFISVSECGYFSVMYMNTFKQQLCNVTAICCIKGARKKQWQGLLG